MKASIAPAAGTPQTPAVSKTLRRLPPNAEAASPGPKPKKRDNIFSKSRDTREDRGTRQAKTKHNSQTLFRSCALL
jgi:hypothetical protein